MTDGQRRIVLYGAGSIGCALAKEVLRRGGTRIVGVLDTDPQKEGVDLGALLGVGPLRVRVSPSPKQVLRRGVADLVLHATSSRLESVVPQIEPALEAGLPVLSTCEELSYPYLNQRPLADRLSRLARLHGVSVMAAGVNPGFVMDKLPMTLLAVCREVRRVHVKRIVDASKRRRSFRLKIGAGMSPAQFEDARREGRIGHVGLEESAGLIAAAAGFRLDRLQRCLKPILTSRGRKVNGLSQSLRAYQGRREVIRLEMKMQMGGVRSLDSVRVEGKPSFEVRIAGGIHGDEGTVGVIVNAIPSLLAAPAGLHTVAEIPFFPLHSAAEHRS
ncbi:MAG: dihydrodipicolinate reductase [Acidobacteriota bacterium]